MSESDGEKAARSVALEQAYVHEVYEQCAEKTAQSRHWPRIYKFLEELEPGALVCDIGCGNGKYLSVNNNVFKVGADRCKRLTDIAREKENEVLICDNLALPFRDESFDAVLSIAVVHHFATTERRVNALKELARVLRIGGRLVISVWAMEQRHRKFESQDVLVPWPKAYYLNSDSSSVCPSGKSSAGGMPCINELDPDRIAQKCHLTSKRNGSRKCKSRSYWIDPIFSPSPSTSSLSSPNETCYSFFRRALQKLAGGKRGSGNRAWFLENWQSGGCKNRRNYESDDIGDVDDIPIELRRLEDDNVTFSKLPDALSIKSKSLGDILEIQRLDLVRSRSSIPGFSSTVTSELYLDEESKTPSPSFTSPPPPPPPPPPPSGSSGPYATTQPSLTERTRADDPRLEPLAGPKAPTNSFSRSFSSGKPRLVKQKTHIPEDGVLEFPEKPQNTAIREIINDLADIQKMESLQERRRNVHKQSSMNEELMSIERLIERDRVRRNIMKQASLNEEIICKPTRTFGNFRDSLLYSANATRRFQLIKSGLTNRIKQSTTSMEKVSSLAIKNGFVKILQGWTSSESHGDETGGVYSTNDEKSTAEISESNNRARDKDSTSKVSKSVQAAGAAVNGNATASAAGKLENEPIERRLSREDGSDSSKDSSLQSDTSVDSEDSFASVIYVPKQQQQQQRLDYNHHYQQQQHQNRFHLQNNKHNHQNDHFPSLIDVTNVPVGCYQLRTTSAPPSPRIKHPPDSHGPRIKLISISPLLKQFPATSKSLPPPSPPGLSPRNLNPFSDPRPFFPPSDLPSFDSLSTIRTVKSPTDVRNECNPSEEAKDSEEVSDYLDKDSETNVPTTLTRDEEASGLDERETEIISEESSSAAWMERCSSVSNIAVTHKGQTETPASVDEVDAGSSKINSPGLKENDNPTANLIKTTVDTSATKLDATISESVGDNQSEKSSTESINDDDSRRTRLIQIKELLRQKPGFATRCAKSSFPLVRRASTATSGRLETIDARTLPRLLSLELYNPETDDLDSDSSGLSSPESVGSVISVISDERFTLKKDAAKANDSEKAVVAAQAEPTARLQSAGSTEATSEKDSRATARSEPSSCAVSSTQSLRLLEAAAGVANSLQDTVGAAVVRPEPHQCRGRSYGHHGHNEAVPSPKNLSDAHRVPRVIHESLESRNSRISRGSRSRERLDSMPEESSSSSRGEDLQPSDRLDYAQALGENIINDIERYCQNTRLFEEVESKATSKPTIEKSVKTKIAQCPKQSESTSTESSTTRSIPGYAPDTIDLLPGVSRLRSNCKYSQLVDDTIAWLRGATGPENDDYSNYADNNENLTGNDDQSIEHHLRGITDEKSREKTDAPLRKCLSEDIMDFVMVSKTGECISMAVSMEIDGEAIADNGGSTATSKFDVSLDNSNSLIIEKLDEATTTGSDAVAAGITDSETIESSESSADNKTSILRYGDSVESTEIEGSIGNSVSLLSDASQTESIGTPRLCKEGGSGSSTTSLVSSNHEYKTLRERRKYLYQKRSASEEIPARNSASDGTCDSENPSATAVGRPDGVEAVGSSTGARRGAERYTGSLRTPNLSGSSSQESLLSDRGGSGGGGAITYHQYYHVFREGELDQLINKYVENLHIISSYYDHASWCIVAEKVQVWTI